MMFVFQSILGLLLVSSHVVLSFVAETGLGRPSGMVESPTTIIKPLSTPALVHEHSTSLHVGISYGPPMDVDQGKSMLLLRRNHHHRFDHMATTPFFDVDPTFTRAVSIAYDAKASQQVQRRRTLTRSLAASTAVVCAAFMAQKAVGVMPYLMSQLPHAYKAFPLQMSILTCGLNSVLADTISQLQAWNPKEANYYFEWRHTLSSSFYGSICLGIGSNLVYTKLLPILLAGTSGLGTVLGSALLDNALFAPLLWLPPAYATKAWFRGESVRAALKGYVHAIQKEKLLHRYASFWMPAQCLTFGLVPQHLRVVSTAAFSFVWMMILTRITSASSSS